MTLEEIIEAECKKSGSSYFHKSEFERILKIYIDQKEKQTTKHSEECGIK